MVDENQLVKIQVNVANCKGYNNLGYKCTIGDIIFVKFCDLYRPTNLVRFKVVCDNCGEEYEMYWSNYKNIQKQNDARCFCKKCSRIKWQNVIEQKYGVDSVFKIKEVQEKIKKTTQEHYGVNHVSQSKEFQNLRKQTNLDKYGSITPFGNKEVQEKSKITLQENYGVNNPSQSKIIQEKIRDSYYKNQTQKVSSQQKELFSYLDDERYKLNYPQGAFSLDIADINSLIAIEYNGGGHNLSVKLGNLTQAKFNQKETYRKKVLYQNGWKIISVISPRNKILEKDNFLELLKISENYFKLEDRHWIEYYIEQDKIITSIFEGDYAQFQEKYNITVND